ncbi:hypothetical protein H9Y05_12550 [Crocinitomicaceae bacterium CZZ-1]|uniref:Uncharacterized protein n=1 Tax=Taishania pollutisoli TaxID=2766479 RepID=A0A8J6U2M3_9FLAO|nr:hypothetical protein [Taishania pollutisoli]MBC9813300.1 hypothetical protein [Taishania pollutisoli]MBX2977576.1 hypothetical protein [Ignavibacteriaceae bacterium]
MNNKCKDFPQYRVLSGRKVYYKIVSDGQFIELSWIGEKPVKYIVTAVQYPERLRIMDMLACEPPYELLQDGDAEQLNFGD